jgi:hypothetical protein
MQVKYATELDHVEKTTSIQCISSDNYSNTDREAYRWTFSDITDPRNFLPRAKIDTNPRLEKDKLKCEGWSLSLYDTEQNAIDNFQKYFGSKPNIGKIIGTHIAKGMIESSDGFCGEVAKNGHFEFFEMQGCDLSSKFQIIAEL